MAVDFECFRNCFKSAHGVNPRGTWTEEAIAEFFAWYDSPETMARLKAEWAAEKEELDRLEAEYEAERNARAEGEYLDSLESEHEYYNQFG
jgi:predicted esterase